MIRPFMRFPEGRERALTLSYDDAVHQDKKLIEMMNRHGIKGTFNVNTGNPYWRGEGGQHHFCIREMKEYYLDNGHEIAVHAVTHPFLEQLPTASALMEVLEDRRNLEQELGIIVRGMAYPMGSTDDELVEALRHSGIVYARTTVATGRFDVPTDWLRMPATCHHNHTRLFELWEQFMAPYTNSRKSPRLFYLWGHSYEFDNDNNWDVIEKFCAAAGGHDGVWYATNIEVYDYVQAYEWLQWSVDMKRVYNPSVMPVWFYATEWPSNTTGCYVVQPGETLELK